MPVHEAVVPSPPVHPAQSKTASTWARRHQNVGAAVNSQPWSGPGVGPVIVDFVGLVVDFGSLPVGLS
eukprot:5522234-Alexandrium_andersonii.AAC.1